LPRESEKTFLEDDTFFVLERFKTQGNLQNGPSSSRRERMRKAFSEQRRLDCRGVAAVQLNLNCRDEIIPVLRALQQIYSQPELRESILELVAKDVNRGTRDDVGREGMDYWQILVLAAVRLGCNLDYDKLQNLAEEHRALRQIMGIGNWDDRSDFGWRRIRDNVCLLLPTTIERISHLVVAEGHRLAPEAVKQVRVDSFVMETNIHWPTESTLIRDGLRKLLPWCVALARRLGVSGWRQAAHLFQKVKRRSHSIERIAARKGPRYQERLKKEYRQLLKLSGKLTSRVRQLLAAVAASPLASSGKVEEIRVFLQRTEQVRDTARRRVLEGETVPNADKLFSLFEPHTQLYKRGKAGEPMQFGRLVLICEDAAGFITHSYLLGRDEQDRDVVVPQTRVVQQRLQGAIEEASFDRGFHSPENQRGLAEILALPCLPKPGAKQAAVQQAEATLEWRAARRRHPGVESAIGALQAGNGLGRSRDHSELGFERYLALGILGRNLHILGKLLIAQEAAACEAARSQRGKSAA
jgi:predicted metal-dependent hydrolase